MQEASANLNNFRNHGLLARKLKSNASIFSDGEVEVINLLLNLNQHHLFEDWDDIGVNDAMKHSFIEQVRNLHLSYPIEGGLSAYVSRSKVLLEKSNAGENPFEGYRPEIPDGTTLEPFSTEFNELERVGLLDVGRCGFILVAGEIICFLIILISHS